MTAQEDALAAIARFLDQQSIPYMVVGGIANLVWGEPRATLDVDVTVWVEPARVEGFIIDICRRFSPAVQDPARFVADTRVLPVDSAGGVRIDIIFALLEFERDAIKRAVDVRMAGTHLHVCTAEDLVLMKISSTRDRDLADARAIVTRKLQELDREYLEPRVEELAVLLDRPEIRRRWREWTAE